MISYLQRDRLTLHDAHEFSRYAQHSGYSRDWVLGLCERIARSVQEPRVLESSRLLGLLGTEGQPTDQQLQRWVALASVKVQGTDGIRGLVAENGEEDRYQVLSRTIDDHLITRAFCTRYLRAWVRQLKSCLPEGTVTTIAIAEDGRDFHEGTDLKGSLIEAISSAGLEIVDLGIIPTPFLAAWSLEQHQPGVMLTASHNPASHNGIKLFLDGKKLYPEGPCGEYALSWYLLTSAYDPAGESGNTQCSDPVLERVDQRTGILSFFERNIGEVPEQVRGIPLLLDAAHGAYSELAPVVCRQLGLHVIPAACSPGPGMINHGRGAALLQDLPSQISYDEQLPESIKELFVLGRSSAAERSYAVVLDGDGDRGYLLSYSRTEDRVQLYDGDDLGLILAQELKRSTGMEVSIRATVESDAALLGAAEAAGIKALQPTGVGDRWLTEDLGSEWTARIGCERSGHVILPAMLPAASEVLYAGNGLLTALKAIISIEQQIADGAQVPYVPYVKGMHLQFSIHDCDRTLWYRDSPLWQDVVLLVRSAMRLEARERINEQEEHMLLFELRARSGERAGRCYIRASGTEPKMNLCLTAERSYQKSCTEDLCALHEKILPLLQQNPATECHPHKDFMISYTSPQEETR